MRILYVEDNDDNVFVLRNRLQRAGHVVLVATDGRQGVEAACEQLPDLVIMDLSLPVLDGWEATRQLKAMPQTRHIPVLALSAHAMNGDRERALAAGCDDFDTKPIDFARLQGKIALLLRGGGPA